MNYQIFLIFLIFGNVFCLENQLKDLNQIAYEMVNALKSIPDASNYYNSNDAIKLVELFDSLQEEIVGLLNGKKKFEIKGRFNEKFKQNQISRYMVLIRTGILDMIKEIKLNYIPKLKNLNSINNLESIISPNLEKAGDRFSQGLFALTNKDPMYYLLKTISALKKFDLNWIEGIGQIVPVAFLYYIKY